MDLFSTGYYAKEVKGLLPKKAFLEAKYKIIYLGIHLLLVLISFYIVKRIDLSVATLGVIFFITHNLSCIGFLSHELSHNAIIRNTKIRKPLEIFFWGMILVPATMWRKVHNKTHHHTMNTPKDPDRRAFRSEKSFNTSIYNKIFYPHKKLKWNPVVGFAFIPYILKNTAAAFYKGKTKPQIVTSKPYYSYQDKRQIAFEILIIAGLQIVFCFYLGWIKWLVVIPSSILLTSFILMTYIVTNHLRNPHFVDKSDPLVTSTSVIVPKFIDKLHYNFSYHTEHHVMPSLNSDYYPEISQILRDKFPDRYNRIPMFQALKETYKSDVLVDDPLM